MTDNKLGLGIPQLLLNRLHEAGWLPGDMKNQDVEKVLIAYQDGAGIKFPIFSMFNNSGASYIAEHAGVSFNTANRVLLTVETMVQDGELAPAWLIPEAQTPFESGVDKIIETSGDLISEAASGTNKMLSSIKWIGFIALGGVGLYYAWPLLSKARKRVK
jgi:hypothetical protein